MKNLSKLELQEINGGGARPGPSVLGQIIAHGIMDFMSGFADRFTRHATK